MTLADCKVQILDLDAALAIIEAAWEQVEADSANHEADFARPEVQDAAYQRYLAAKVRLVAEFQAAGWYLLQAAGERGG